MKTFICAVLLILGLCQFNGCAQDNDNTAFKEEPAPQTTPEDLFRLFVNSIEDGNIDYTVELAQDLFPEEIKEAPAEKLYESFEQLHRKVLDGYVEFSVLESTVEGNLACVLSSKAEIIEETGVPTFEINDTYFIYSAGKWRMLSDNTELSPGDRNKLDRLKDWYEKKRAVLKEQSEKAWFSTRGIYGQKEEIDYAVKKNDLAWIVELGLGEDLHISNSAIEAIFIVEHQSVNPYELQRVETLLGESLSGNDQSAQLKALKMVSVISAGYQALKSYNRNTGKDITELPEHIVNPFYVEFADLMLETAEDPSPDYRLPSIRVLGDILVSDADLEVLEPNIIIQGIETIISGTDDASAEVRLDAYKLLHQLNALYEIPDIDDLVQKGLNDEDDLIREVMQMLEW